MKVNGTGPSSTDGSRNIGGVGGAAGVTTTQDARGKSKTSKSLGAGVASSDNVSISTRARDAKMAKDIAKAAPDEDAEKIARLKSAIQAGTYKVDAEKIADRLVDDHLSMPL